MALHHMLRAAAGASAPSDPNFNNVSLLLSGDGTNGAQNNTFLDSSTNNFTITRNGNTTQGTFSPYGDLWSNYFNGAVGTYLSAPSSSNLALGSGDFTVEFWIYALDNGPGDGRIIIDQNVTGSMFWFLQNGVINFRISNVSTPLTAALPATNTWVHVAVARQSGTLRAFINGTLSGYATDNYNYTQNGTYIGVFAGAGEWNMYGYLSNLRIVKGTALYTSNFTPSTTPLTAVSGTSLLTCQSNRFIDNSSNNFTITRNGNTSVQRFSPFNPTAPYDAATLGGSGYFDGTGDYLSAPSNTAWTWSTSSAWSAEAFIYPTTLSTYNPVFCTGVSGVSNTLDFYLDSSGYLIVRYWNGGEIKLTSSSTVKLNQWSHVVFAFNGTTLSTYINGNRVASASKQGTPESTTNPLLIGYMVQGAGTGYFTGYIVDSRIINGTLQYDPSQTTITIPTAPLTVVTNTKILLSYTNAGIPDAAMMNDLETVGNAQVSTSVKKYGTGSLAFDGTGDWLTLPVTPQTSLGSTYTIEGWIYLANTSGIKAIYSHSVASTGSYGYLLFYVTGTSLGFYVRPSTGGTESGLTAGTLSATTWTHVAISVDNNSARMFINGTQVGSTTTVAATTYTPVYSTVGADIVQGYPMNGYIDDLRITKGYARYTSNFTPPAAALPTF